MPILLTYSPTYAGAQAAENVGDERQRQIRAQEALRRQQAYEEQRRYDEQMQEKQRQDFINNLFRSRQLDNEEQRNAELSFYRDQALGQRAQLSGESDAEKFRRLKERLASQGDMQGARIAANKEQAALNRSAAGDRNQRSIDSREKVADWSLTSKEQEAEAQRQYLIRRDQEHAHLIRDLSDQKMAALQRAATARDDATRRRELITAGRIDLQVATAKTHLHYQDKPKPDALSGQIDPNAMANWNNQHRALVEQERAAQSAIDQLLTSAPPQPTAGGINPNYRRDTPAAFQNDPLQEGPIIGGGQNLPPLGQADDVMNEAGGGDPQLAAFAQFYNQLPRGSPYTAPDGTHRVKQ